MSSEGGELVASRPGGIGVTKPTEPEQLPCPRCDSTNTKFCYYNNYNLSQPRHFCKACRRYWTRGGALRNVPVGGGTRKSSASSLKRPRTTTHTSTASSSSTTTTQEVLNSVPVSTMVSEMGHGAVTSGSLLGCDVNLNEALPDAGSFSSLLSSNTHVGGGFMALPGGYVGLGLGPGLYGMGYGLNVFDFPMQSVGNGDLGGGSAAAATAGGGNPGAGNVGGGAVSSGCNTWQMEGGLADGDSFGWPDLAISTPGKGLK